MRVEPQRRKRLDKGHIALLEMLFRFRFGTTDLLARSQGKRSGAQVYKRLRTLLEQGYVGRRYETGYRLRGQGASYFLLAKGLQQLKQFSDVGVPQQVLHKMRRDKVASDRFIQHNLAVLDIYSHFRALYGDEMVFSTLNDMEALESAENPLPDAILNIAGIEFALEILQEAEPLTSTIKKLGEYVKQGRCSVKVLCVCETTSLQQKLQKRLSGVSELSGLSVYIASRQNLARIDEDERVWFNASESDLPRPIHELIAELA